MINAEVFKDMSYGMYIVGSIDGEKSVGCIANSVMQITSQNPTVAISINHENYTNECIKKQGVFSISILPESVNGNVISIFGFSSGRQKNKWQSISHTKVENMPVMNEACGYMICKLIDTLETQTHTVFLGEVIVADKMSDVKAMTYDYYHNVIKGKSPKNAPTYIEEIQNENKYVCDICGYVYDGEIPFEDLPDDYKCPVCGVGKEHFKNK